MNKAALENNALRIVFGMIAGSSLLYVGAVAYFAMLLRKISPSLQFISPRQDVDQLRLERVLSIMSGVNVAIYVTLALLAICIAIFVFCLATEDGGDWQRQEAVGRVKPVSVWAAIVVGIGLWCLLLIRFSLKWFGSLAMVDNASLYNTWMIAFCIAVIPTVTFGIAILDGVEVAPAFMAVWMGVLFVGYKLWHSQVDGLL